MENNQLSPQDTQIIYQTTKSILIDVSKYLKKIYITGIVIVSFFVFKLLTQSFFRPLYSPLYKSNRRLYDFIHDFYFFSNHIIYAFMIGMLSSFAFKYQKSLVKAINSNNEHDLVDSFRNLKMLIKMISVYLILGFVAFLLMNASNFYSLTYH